MDLSNPTLTDYAGLIHLLNQDRQQTLSLNDRGMKEMNPLLGSHPGSSKVNAYFGALAAAPLLIPDSLPEWLKTSAIASANYGEKLVTDQNKQAFAGKVNPKGLPFGLAFKTYSDWDRPIEDFFRKKSPLFK